MGKCHFGIKYKYTIAHTNTKTQVQIKNLFNLLSKDYYKQIVISKKLDNLNWKYSRYHQSILSFGKSAMMRLIKIYDSMHNPLFFFCFSVVANSIQ